jgi:hypothetical protein
VGNNDGDSKWLYGGCLLLCLGIGVAVFVGEYVIPKVKEHAVETLRTNKDARGAAASAVQQITTAGKDVREEYENYLATMRSVGALAGDAGKAMSFEEFKRQWERQGEGRVERWIQEADLAKVFSKVGDRRVFLCWCQAKGYISVDEFRVYNGWQSDWYPDKLARYVDEYVKAPIPGTPEKGKQWSTRLERKQAARALRQYHRCLEGRDAFGWK